MVFECELNGTSRHRFDIRNFNVDCFVIVVLF